MSWKEDWPIIGIAKDGNDYGEPVLTYRKPNVGEAAKEAVICEPDASDDFAKKTLGLQWQWNANPKEDWYNITSDGLCLNAVKQEEKIKHGDYPSSSPRTQIRPLLPARGSWSSCPCRAP